MGEDNAVIAGRPSPLGLVHGFLAVFIGQMSVIIYHWMHLNGKFGFKPRPIQLSYSKENFWTGLKSHISNPEGFLMLASYLTITWMLRLLPKSYYDHEDGVNWI